MALRSPTGRAPRDPFELERLAQELAERELNSPPYKQSFDDRAEYAHELPVYAPLAHDNPFFTAESFNVEEFLLSRTHTSLPDLRSELRDYLALLKEELVKLINDDYEAFISLSTDLKGEGERLEKLKFPLGDLEAHIIESRNELQMVQDNINSKLQKRTALREEKTYLHLLLKINESVTRLESLLLIASSDEQSPSGGKTLSLAKTLSSDDDGHDERTRGSRAKHLARVATEYTQLLYHVEKAQSGDRSLFIDEIQWRISRIQSTLSSDLDHLFTATLTSLTDSQHKGDRSKLMVEISECLQTYDMMGLWQDAEDVLKRDVIREFVKKTIFPGALNAPHSPLLPVTPFPVRIQQHQTTSLLPKTPYTPFTAFAMKEGQTFDMGSPSVHLLDDFGNPLAALYNTILKFVERDLKQIMDIAEKISVKSATKATAPDLTSPEGRLHTFDILSNVIWAEVGRAIMDELGSVVFAAGKPNEFRKNYETTQAFIRSLQLLGPSTRAVKAMVDHPTYHALERRWQLPVYFQLRWKEIIPPLEDALASQKVEPNAAKGTPFESKQAAAVWKAIETCWSGEVFIPNLAHRFWKLSLQALSRYRSWIERAFSASAIPSKTPISAVGDRVNSPSVGSPRPSTPVQNSESLAVDIVAEDAILRQASLTMADIEALEKQVLHLWRETISLILPDNEDEGAVSAEDALSSSMLSLTALVQPLSAQIIAILSRRACEALAPVRSIPTQFRAMADKKIPTEPSFFIGSVLRPVKLFFTVERADDTGTNLKGKYLAAYASEVFENATQKYISHLLYLKKTEESLRRLKKGRKPTFSLFGGGSGREDDSRDEERIRAQMVLDVRALGKNAASLGIDIDGSTSFRELTDLAHTSFVDDSVSAP